MTNFKEELRGVKAFVFDIDGVLSTQTIALSVWGIPLRTVNLRDGYAIQLAVKEGIPRRGYLRRQFKGIYQNDSKHLV
jgi:3-deoxy-D-manno-octulosonate 8-phosphate phosphatase (KDO 8-P phosphatase)